MSQFISNDKYAINIDSIVAIEWHCFDPDRSGHFTKNWFNNGQCLKLYFRDKADDDIQMKLEQLLKHSD
ncbi:hypothetical protein AB0756_39560 [Tolypothrix campylonemoides VB511288_2]|uniref:Uncharacterized protein n=2 Tax=Nostocales TaxID=1161 RepID=A0ABW8WK10_9CYAN